MSNTFQYDLYRLAVGILYINLGRAAVEFPFSTKAHPSYKIRVFLLPIMTMVAPEHRALFPFDVRWDIWHRVVVPLFEKNKAWQVLVPASADTSLQIAMNSTMLSVDLPGLFDKIQTELMDGFVTARLVPPTLTRRGYIGVEDGPLAYRTDIEMKAIADRIAATAFIRSVWEIRLETEAVPLEPIPITVDEDIPAPTVERLGTVSLTYTKYD